MKPCVKVVVSLKDFLFCEILISKDRKKARLGQPSLIVDMEKKFEEQVMKMESHNAMYAKIYNYKAYR